MDDRTSGCPMHGGSPLSDESRETVALRSLLGRTNRDWWPNQLSLDILPTASPLGDDFDYAAAFRTLDLAAVKADEATRAAVKKLLASLKKPAAGAAKKLWDFLF